jgi:hypothetical protein
MNHSVFNGSSVCQSDAGNWKVRRYVEVDVDIVVLVLMLMLMLMYETLWSALSKI